MLKRSFSGTEKVLLLILSCMLVVGAYILLVHNPVMNQTQSLRSESEFLDVQMEDATLIATQYNVMKEELARILALPENQQTILPAHDNLGNLMPLFNETMKASPRYQLTFGETTEENGVLERPIQFSFDCDSYEIARQILTELTKTGYRCLMDEVKISVRSNENAEGGYVTNSPLEVVCNIVFYEKTTGIDGSQAEETSTTKTSDTAADLLESVGSTLSGNQN